MQKKQRFIADQRFDLPHYDSMLANIDYEFQSYNKVLVSPLNKIIKGWTIETASGLTVRVNRAANSLLLNSERDGYENINFRDAGEDYLTIALTNNATNYVEVQLETSTGNEQTVSLWDPTANDGEGEEYSQAVDTCTHEIPTLVANTIAFSGDPDKLPLAIVTTSGGSVSLITDAREMLFHLDTDWTFGGTDKTIYSIKDAYDALATRLKQVTGGTTWYDTVTHGANRVPYYNASDFYSTSADFTYIPSASGSTAILSVAHQSNTASSHAQFLASVAGSSAGDPAYRLSTTAIDWYAGLDNSDSDRYYVGTGSTIGSSPVFRAFSDGTFGHYGPLITYNTAGVAAQLTEIYAGSSGANTGGLVIYGGNGSGGYIAYYGATHATNPGVISFSGSSRFDADGNFRVGASANLSFGFEKMSVRFFPLSANAASTHGNIEAQYWNTNNTAFSGTQTNISADWRRTISADITDSGAIYAHSSGLGFTTGTFVYTNAQLATPWIIQAPSLSSSGGGGLELAHYSGGYIAASTVNTGVRKSGFFVGAQTLADNNASFTDNDTWTGDWLFNFASTLPCLFSGHVYLGNAQEVRFRESGGTDYVGLKAPAVATSVTFTLPDADGTNGQFLKTDGATVLSFATPSVGVFPPGFTKNLGFTYSGGTFTVCGADGTALSGGNPGYVTLHSKASPGEIIEHEITANQAFIDDAGASEIIGNLFGATTGVAWAQDVPFFIYAVANDAENAVAFMLSRDPRATVSPAEASIGAPDDPVADSTTAFFSFDSLDEALYDGNPCAAIGAIRMRMTTSDDWTVQTLTNQDGIGRFHDSSKFLFPTGQMGAAAGGYLKSNGGTPPSWTSQTYSYWLRRNGEVHIAVTLDGDGGTDGSGGVNTILAVPIVPNATYGTPIVGNVQSVYAGAAAIVRPDYTSAGGGIAFTIWTSSSGLAIDHSNFTNAGRRLSVTATYQGFGFSDNF